MNRFPAGCVILGSLLLAACSPKSSPPEQQPAAATATPKPVSAESTYATLEHEYVVFFLRRFPVVATYLGGSAFDESLGEVDGTLRNYSAAALVEEDGGLAEFKQRFTALQDSELSARRRIDKSVALAQIEFLLHQHQARQYQQRALDSFIDEPFRGVDWQMQGMAATGTQTYGSVQEWQQVIARLRAVPAYFNTAKQQLSAGIAAKNTPDWRTLIQFGLHSAEADAEYFSKTLPAIAAKAISDPQRDTLLRDLQSASKNASVAYLLFRDFVADTFFDDVKGVDAAALKPDFRADNYALGETEYDWALRNNLRLQKSAAQLFDESWATVEQTSASMIELARKIAAAHQWRIAADGHDAVTVVFDRLSADAPRTDAEMIEGYRAVGRRLVDYARRTGLFAVPDEYRLDVTVTPPPLRSGIDGAAYYPAPPFKTTGVGRFYVTPTGDDLAALRQQHNRSGMADLAAHEGFPGHDWHFKVMSQHRDEISPVRWLTPGAVEDSSSMWEDSMAAEGWALYSEGLLAEPQAGAANGFYTPEEHLYQLRGKLYRDLRIRIDTGLHLGKMEFEVAVTLFSTVVDFLPGSCTDAKALQAPAKRSSCSSARSAVTRYSRWPTQAITYRLGRDQIVELRARAQQQLGDKFSLQRFHTEFMKQGTIATSYFADEMLLGLRQ